MVPICYVDVVHAAPIAAVFETAVAEILDPAIIAAIPVEVGLIFIFSNFYTKVVSK